MKTPKAPAILLSLLVLLTCLLMPAGQLRAQNLDLGVPGVQAETTEAAKVTASIVSEAKTVAAGKAFRVAVKLDHAPHHHSYGKTLPADGTGKPTKLIWTLPAGWRAEDLKWPEPHETESTGGEKSLGYDGAVYLPVSITPAAEASGQVELKLVVDALVCDPSTCMPFKTDAAVKVTVGAQVENDPGATEAFAIVDGKVAAPGATAQKAPVAAGSFAGYLLFAFIGGLILNIMPCVFPVLGIKILGVVQQAGEDKRKVVLHGLAYTLGVLICFWALGGLVISLGKAWGFQLQSPGFVYGLAIFFMIFGLNMAGLFEIGTSAIGVGAELQSSHGYKGSFFSGLLATVVATPCSAPFLGSALGYTVTLPAFQAMLMFTTIGIGLASPFLLLSLFPKLVSALPRPGAWMESFKQGMSFLLFGTVAFLAWVLTGMVEGQPMLFGLLGFVMVALGCWIYGRWCLPHKAARTRMVSMILALLFVSGGVWGGWPEIEKKWDAWSPEKVAELRKEGKPVYVDYTAKWCATCQWNKRVYKNAGLQKLIDDKKIILLKADWTNDDPRITKALSDLGKAAVPVNVLYVPGQDAPIVLPDLLTVDNVSEEFKKVK